MTNWLLWFLVGILSLLGGIFALANPIAATLTATLIAGWTFTLVGALTAVSAFSDQGWGARITAILLGVIFLVLGVSLVGNPLAGTLSLTWIVAVLLLIAGVFRIFLAFGSENIQIRMAMILSGLVSLILGVMIITNWPQSAIVVLGVFLAVELISNGVSLIVLSLARRSDAPADTGMAR